ncbi:MAG: dimethyl sulfoxide reductase anchor subunit [Gammaproteobacteria bacterium]|jgi:DMSO reductase iron-sulfur subunit
MFEPRPDEPSYAFVPDAAHPESNRYGTPIETVPAGHELRGKSLNINGDAGVPDTPNRYKQHGFYFNADNCIACHACEAACSEKNDLPAHIAFRSVGYVEGGTWPAYQRLNISMACNHCDDPVCLKGCPTRAYTKFAEYGAVLQDPDICFGCGYCTWVCPYNAPQLDTRAGHVSKCNMCVDRLEAGLKPACVSACLAGALDFGIMETVPENRDQLEATLPGFPTPEISQPNIRFQQTRSLPHEMRRPDAMPLRYERSAEQGDAYRSRLDAKPRTRAWNLQGLSTRENPLVVFTLISQAVIGAFLSLFLGPLFGLETLSPGQHPVAMTLTLFGLIGIQTLALVLSTLHLGRPHRFYRAFNNLRWSPVSREVAGIAVFYNFLGAYTLLAGLPMLFDWLPAGFRTGLVQFCGWGAVVSGLSSLYFMQRIYRIRARPFWNHWQILTAFYGNMLALGPLLVALVFIALRLDADLPWGGTAGRLAAVILTGLLMEATGLFYHARALRGGSGEARASHYEQTTTFGRPYRLRNACLLLATIIMLVLATARPAAAPGLLLWLAGALAVLAAAVIGRALFYALVIPTTMPGAFFWRNRYFENHARETGLAEMPQVGVLPESH